MSTIDRDTRIKTHYAAARFPELVQQLLASDLSADDCVVKLCRADSPQNYPPVAPTTSPVKATSPATVEQLSAEVTDSFNRHLATIAPGKPVIQNEAETLAASIIDAYHQKNGTR